MFALFVPLRFPRLRSCPNKSYRAGMRVSQQKAAPSKTPRPRWRASSRAGRAARAARNAPTTACSSGSFARPSTSNRLTRPATPRPTITFSSGSSKSERRRWSLKSPDRSLQTRLFRPGGESVPPERGRRKASPWPSGPVRRRPANARAARRGAGGGMR
jgi:hypothetical protein